MNTNKKQKLAARLTRNGVHADVANALAQSGLLTYEQSRSVTGREAVRKQALDAYEAAPNRATVTRTWNADRMEFDYEVKTADRAVTFTALKEARGYIWLCDAAVFRLAAYGTELRTLTREVKHD